MNNYTSTTKKSPRQGFTRFSLFCEEELILEIDHKYDAQNDLQIYLNSSFNSKNPANNNFPKEWVSYEVRGVVRGEQLHETKTYQNLQHISFHPRPHFSWENQSRNTKITFENAELFIAGENKDEEFFPLINFVREKSDDFVELITIIQNAPEDVREKLKDDKARAEVEKMLELGLNSGDSEHIGICKGIKENPEIYEYYVKVAKSSIEDRNFKIDENENYVLRVGEMNNHGEIQARRKDFNVSKLDFILVGNMDFSSKTDIPEGKEVLIDYF
jgi:hypothetical protein